MSFKEIEEKLMTKVDPSAPFALEDRQISTWDGKMATVKAFRNYKRTWRELYIDLMKTFGEDHKREMFVYSDMGQNENERMTYPQFFGLVGAVARALVAAPYNVKVGDKIGVASRNCVEWMAVW